MRTSLKLKTFAVSIILVAVTAVGMSVAYYLLARQTQHRYSQERIRIAFDIVLDDLNRQLQAASQRVDEFLAEDVNLRMALRSYNRSPDWLGEKRFISTYLKKAVDDLKKFGNVASINRLALYAQNRRLLGIYQRHGEQEDLGGFVLSQSGKDAYLPIDGTPESENIVFAEETPIPDAPLPAGFISQFEDDISEQTISTFFAEDDTLGIRLIAPVYRNEEISGVLVGEIFFRQPLVEYYAELSNTDVTFFAGTQRSVGTLDAHTQLGADVVGSIEPCTKLSEQEAMPLFTTSFGSQTFYQGRCALTAGGAVLGAITVNLSQAFEQQANRKLLLTILLIAVGVAGVACGLSMLVSRRTLQAVYEIGNVILAVSDGDLRNTVVIKTHDEIASLGERLNTMIMQWRSLSGQVQHVSQTVNGTAGTVLTQMNELVQHIRHQTDSVDETTSAITMIREFIGTVAQNTNTLFAATEQILASVQEMRASIAEVTTSTGFVSSNLHQISSSVDQMNQTMEQVTDNTEQLAEASQYAETEIQHIDQSLQDVSANAAQAQDLAEETKNFVIRGQSSVEASREGMLALKEVIARTATIIQEINTWGEQVSSILGIVNEITEQTSLLSLNAAIISAQAGTAHGRSFAVVADEIKDLANRTRASTQEISTMIRELQQKTEAGVDNIHEGLAKADEGMQLAEAVQFVLETILDSATRSSNRATDTARLLRKTAQSSQKIKAQMANVTDMVASIKQVMQSERQDVMQVSEAVESLSSMAIELNRASVEQKHAVEEIEQSMGETARQFTGISEESDTLLHDAQQIVTAMQTIEAGNRAILNNAAEIADKHIQELLRQAETLQQSVDIFKT